MNEYYCPHCGDILNHQHGFDPALGVWTCTNCGQQLMDDEMYYGDRFEGIAWYCDECGALLNVQQEFSDSDGTWTCTNCGHINDITENNIIDRKHFVCPQCGDTLNNQPRFNIYNTEWVCTECGASLYHSDYRDDFSIIKPCPNCYANLTEQWDFDDDDDWICENCGSHLHKVFFTGDYEIVTNENSESDSNYGTTLDDSETFDDEDDSDSEEDNDNDDESCTEPDDSTSIENNKTVHDDSVINISQNHDFIRIRPESKSYLRRKRILAFFSSQKRISIGYSSSELEKKNFNDVKMLLYNRAFKNIRFICIKDVYLDSHYQEHEVEKVSIDGQSAFSNQETAPYDAEIIITYHDKREILLPFSAKSLRKADHREIKQKLIDLGFTNVLEQPIKDLTTGWVKKYGSVEVVKFNNSREYKKGAIFQYDVPITIIFHVFKKTVIYD